MVLVTATGRLLSEVSSPSPFRTRRPPDRAARPLRQAVRTCRVRWRAAGAPMSLRQPVTVTVDAASLAAAEVSPRGTAPYIAGRGQ